jgi:hypothetical protein
MPPMLRRPLTVAAILSLLVAGTLLAGYVLQVPLYPHWIGDPQDGWSITLYGGRAVLSRETAGVLASAPWSARYATLAIPFAVFPLAWFAAVVRRERRNRHVKGFPIEVPQCSSSPTPSESKL